MTGATDLLILIPAAGASRRMGLRDKCLEPVRGEPALRHSARLALATGARVLVTLPADGARLPGRQAALADLAVDLALLADAGEGMAASLRAGAHAAGAQAAQGLMILLPDMPDIGRDDLCAVIATFARNPLLPVRATAAEGTPGHPVILPASLFPDVARLQGDRGARDLFQTHPAVACPLPGDRALTDLDQPDGWDRWHALHS
jgi:molybdenum cofactor cytidylyltransferase